MKFNEFIENIFRALSPVKSLLGLYILLYLIPLFIPLYIVSKIWNRLILSNNSINWEIMWTIIICAGVVTIWTTFFLIYFTKIRTKNPRLYGKIFISDFKTITETSDSTFAETKQE